MFEGYGEWLEETCPITEEVIEDMFQRSKSMSCDELYDLRRDSDYKFAVEQERQEILASIAEEMYEREWQRKHPFRTLANVICDLPKRITRYRNTDKIPF